MHPLLALLPLVALVMVMALRAPKHGLPLAAHVALPGAAGLALLLQAFAGSDAAPAVLAARVIEGLLTSLTPLAIVFGAILLFQTLRASGAMDSIAVRLERAVPDPVLRALLIGWSFSYLVEGLSGFGTPAAIAAPLLVGLGFQPIRAAAACLVMNTVPVVFGAVGMPVWFGLGEPGLSREQLLAVGSFAAILQCAAAPVVVMLALRMLFPWSALRARAPHIAAIVAATVFASWIVAQFSVEFPSIVAGGVAIVAGVVAGRLARPRAGPAPAPPKAGSPVMPAWRAALPLLATALLLAVTRIEPIGLRALLNADAPAATLPLGALGTLSVSASLVVSLRDILGTGLAWSMPILYVPFILPFVAVSLLSAPLLGLTARDAARLAGDAGRRLALPAIALAGALVFVKLMSHGGDRAPVVVMGRAMADAVAAVHEPLWLAAAPLVGALGAFFSGSATVSNLTFAPVQAEIAERLGLATHRVLALQTIGAALGNMACVHNIVAVAAVLGLTSARAARAVPGTEARDADPVSSILRLNAPPLAAALAVVALAAAAMSLI